MRKLFIFTAILVITFSCRFLGFEKKNTPEYAAKAFLTHFQKLEIDKDSEYGTENTKTIIQLFKGILSLVPDSTKNENNFSNIIIKYCVKDKNTAVCHYIANEKEETINLLKIDGKWLVDLKKEQKNPFKFKK